MLALGSSRKNLAKPRYLCYFLLLASHEEAAMRRLTVSAVCILLFSLSPAWAEFYRYVDRDGKEFFTNDLKQVPQEYRSSAAPVKTDDSRVSVGDKPVGSGRSTGTMKEHKDKDGRGEQYWRKRADKLRQQLRTYQDEYDLIVKQEKDEEGKPRKLTSRKNKSLSSREKKKALLEKKISRKKQELEVDLPEIARKADAYPGWIRE